MGFLPEFGEEMEEVFSRPKTAEPAPQTKSSLQERLIPHHERDTSVFPKEQVMVLEDDDLVEWERVIRQYLGLMPKMVPNRTASILVWEWATGMTSKDVDRSTMLKDSRRINKVLKYYFGEPRNSFIDGRKLPMIYDIRKGFLVHRKAPMNLSLYLEWKKGAEV